VRRTFTFRVDEDDEGTLDALGRLREYIKDGRGLRVVADNECADGSNALVLAVYPAEPPAGDDPEAEETDLSRQLAWLLEPGEGRHPDNRHRRQAYPDDALDPDDDPYGVGPELGYPE